MAVASAEARGPILSQRKEKAGVRAGGSFRDINPLCTRRGLRWGLYPCPAHHLWLPSTLGWLDPLPQGRACSPTLGSLGYPHLAQLCLFAGWDATHRKSQQAGNSIE